MQIEEWQRVCHRLEQARDRYADLYDFAPVAYFILVKDGSIREANIMAARRLGVKEGSLKNRFLSDFIAAYDQEAFWQFCRQVCGSRVQQGCELDMIREDGCSFRAQLEGVGVREGNDWIDAQRVVVTDITERKHLEDSRDKFFSIASHEIRTPLTNITLSLELLARGEAGTIPPQARDMIDIARHGARRLTRLVNEILVVQRLNAGKIVMYKKPLELLPLVEEAIQANTAYASQFNVRYLLKPTDFDIKVKADSDRLIQVLNNLLSNASKYSPANDDVDISVSRRDAGVRVSISDHGPGIPEHFRDQVFDAFAHAKPSLKDDRHKESSGLGLVIAKAIIERLGGRIGFNSIPHVVTTFYFDLPEWQDR
ncbi:MAG: PAS domain-containing sensor histidine kinase [Gammaproteobacteria bacterium]|nr:PAS domain-containing sensor histidine kinase [Gammaproteobacteria bacterium]